MAQISTWWAIRDNQTERKGIKNNYVFVWAGGGKKEDKSELLRDYFKQFD